MRRFVHYQESISSSLLHLRLFKFTGLEKWYNSKKKQLFNSIFKSEVLHGNETCQLNKQIAKKLLAFILTIYLCLLYFWHSLHVDFERCRLQMKELIIEEKRQKKLCMLVSSDTKRDHRLHRLKKIK